MSQSVLDNSYLKELRLLFLVILLTASPSPIIFLFTKVPQFARRLGNLGNFENDTLGQIGVKKTTELHCIHTKWGILRILKMLRSGKLGLKMTGQIAVL